jgi:hypothetical protein
MILLTGRPFDIPSFYFYEVDPQPTVPEPSSKGRKARRLITGQKSLSAEEFVQSCSAEHWRVHHVRETTRGSLKLRVLRKSVANMQRRHEMRRRAIESHAKRNPQAQFKVT